MALTRNMFYLFIYFNKNENTNKKCLRKARLGLGLGDLFNALFRSIRLSNCLIYYCMGFFFWVVFCIFFFISTYYNPKT